MVNLCGTIIRRLNRESKKDKEIAELVALLKKMTPYAEAWIDGKIELEELKRYLAADKLEIRCYA